MQIATPRFLLRDFSDGDRQAFIDYQLDPRYQALYGQIDADAGRANGLFDLFGAWRRESPRQNLQICKTASSQDDLTAGFRVPPPPRSGDGAVWFASLAAVGQNDPMPARTDETAAELQ